MMMDSADITQIRKAVVFMAWVTGSAVALLWIAGFTYLAAITR